MLVNLFNVYELDILSLDLHTNFTLIDCLFGAVKMTQDADPDKCFYSGYVIGLDSQSFLFCSKF